MIGMVVELCSFKLGLITVFDLSSAKQNIWWCVTTVHSSKLCAWYAVASAHNCLNVAALKTLLWPLAVPTKHCPSKLSFFLCGMRSSNSACVVAYRGIWNVGAYCGISHNACGDIRYVVMCVQRHHMAATPHRERRGPHLTPSKALFWSGQDTVDTSNCAVDTWGLDCRSYFTIL